MVYWVFIEYKKKMMESNNVINLKEDEENEFPKENELVYVSINYICNNYLLENSAK